MVRRVVIFFQKQKKYTKTIKKAMKTLSKMFLFFSSKSEKLLTVKKITFFLNLDRPISTIRYTQSKSK